LKVKVVSGTKKLAQNCRVLFGASFWYKFLERVSPLLVKDNGVCGIFTFIESYTYNEH